MAFGGFTDTDDRAEAAKAPHILVVCTANRCRSPMGEVILADALRKIGRSDVQVDSAGFMEDGIGAERESAEAVIEIGLTLSAHRSRKLSKELVQDADLILTMERAHVRELAVRYRAFDKAFTVKEFLRRAQELPAQREEELDHWVARVHAGRTTAELMGSDAADEVADPIGKPLADFVKTRDELREIMTSIARLVP